jgi:multidrug resistance efflux pump
VRSLKRPRLIFLISSALVCGSAQAQTGVPRPANPQVLTLGAIAEAGFGVARARAEEAHDALQRANGLQAGVTVTRAQLFTVERDSRIADVQQLDAAQKLALLKAGSRVEDIDEAQAKRDAASAILEEGKAEFDQCTVRAPASGAIQFTATGGPVRFSLFSDAARSAYD